MRTGFLFENLAFVFQEINFRQTLKYKSMLHKIYFICIIFLFEFTPLYAQIPVPASAQSGPIVLQNATIHQGNGNVISNGSIRFENGLITEVGTSVNTQGADLVNAAGKHIYPGLILPATSMGIVEISAIRQSRDQRETGEFNPNVRSIVAYNTDSDILPTTRSNGILLIQTTPEGGIVSGLSSVMELDGWDWEEAQHTPDDGIHLNWARYFSRTGWWAEPGEIKKNEQQDEFKQALEDIFRQAQVYAQKNEATNLKFEAMKGLFDGTKRLYIHAEYSKEIIESVQFAQKYQVKKIVIVGAEDAVAVADFLKQNDIPVILYEIHRLPDYPEDDVWQPYKAPAILHKAGVKVALAYSDPTRARNLPFLAGTAAAYGLSKEEALQLVTSHPAQILGIGEKVGTLEKGKQATLVVSEGDLLDMRTSQVSMAFIQGKKIDLNDKHKALYNHFQKKYNDK